MLSRLAAAVPPASWRGIGLSGMIPTLVTLDEAGEPTGPAITWEDSRAHKEAEEIVWQAGAAEIYELTGQPLDGRYLLPMAAWLTRHEPDRMARTSVVLGAKDYLFFKLTGHFLTDPSTATGYGCYGLAGSGWAAPVTAVAGVSAGTGRPGRPGLPPVVPSADTRPLLPEVAERLGLPAGLRVSVGAADSVLAAEALGAVQPGTVAYVWGTSTVVLGAASTLTLDPERRCLITPLAVMGWGVEMDLVSTGARRRLALPPAGLRRDGAGGGRRGRGGRPRRHRAARPALRRRRASRARSGTPTCAARVLGLDLSHGPADVARAVLDGIILESRRCLARLRDLGLPQGEVRAAWGGVDPWLCQRLADAAGRPVLVGDPDVASSAAGAARLAALGTGPALPPAEGGRRYTPDPARTAEWDRRMAEYDEVLGRLQPFYRAWPPRSREW